MAMKKLLLASLLLSTSVSAEQFVVQDIRIDGLQRVSLGAALLAMPVRVGDTIDDGDVSSLIKNLFATGNFEDVRVFREGNVLMVDVVERPTIASISFSGNKSIKSELLEENLNASGLRVGEALDRTTLADTEKALSDFYYSTGKYNAEVETIITPLPRNRADVKFVFTEGESAVIEQINLVGNRVFSDDELLDNFTLQAQVPWWKFFSDTQYQKQVLAGDLENLRSFYLNHGYLKFRVVSTNVSISPNKKSVYITLNVDEGQQYKVSGVNFIGKQAQSYAALSTITTGAVYNGEEVTLLEDAIKRQLGEQGFAYPQVVTMPEFDDENGTVALNVNVEQGKRVYVRNIIFKGNTETKDEVLRREMRQLEGTWLNASAVQTGKERLDRLGFFEAAEVRTIRVPNSDDQVDIEYSVKEANSGSINFGIGYGTESGVSLQLGLQQDNFAGTGNLFGISATVNDFQTNFTANYRDPYWTVDGVSLGGQIFFDRFQAQDANIIDYTDQSYGANISWGFPITEVDYLNFTLGYTHRQIENLTSYYQVEKFLDSMSNNLTDNGGLKVDDYDLALSWTHNTLNRGIFPTSGNVQQASFKMTVPGSDSQYFKVQYDSRNYFPLTESEDYTLLLRGRLGYGNGYGKDGNNDYLLPFYENFYAGGFSSLRGFRANTVGPKAVYDVGLGNNAEIIGTNASVGGNAIAVASAEVFFPTPFVSEDFRNSLRTSLFVDAATVWDTEFDLAEAQVISGNQYVRDYSDPNNVRASYGVALQWRSPLGPLVFSLARPFKVHAGDDEEFFSFTIGQTF